MNIKMYMKIYVLLKYINNVIMEWVEMDSNNDLTTAVCTRPEHQTAFKSWILWVEVPYVPSGTSGEAS
jgi:hypothetical protein